MVPLTSHGVIQSLLGRGDAAEWSQFLAVLIGLGIAVGVPWAQRRNEIKDRKKRNTDEAIDLALLVFPDLMEYCQRLQSAIISIEVKHRGFLSHEEVREFDDDTEWPLFDRLKTALELPQSVLDRIEKLHRFGPLARGIQELLHLSRTVQGDFVALDQHNRISTDPLDLVSAHSAVSSARVLKACAFRVRNQFWRFLSDNLDDRFIEHARRAGRYEY